MGKGANKQLLTNAGAGQKRSQKLQGESNDLYGQLDPMLLGEATNPTGYSPTDLAAINTASQQSLGGSTAGITGQANLTAARTRNAGGFQGAVGTAGRNAQKQLSQNALGVQEQNANLKEAQKQQALSALQGLYGTNLQGAMGYLNSSNESLKDENASHPLQSGFNTFANVLSSLTGAATAGKKIADG